MNEPYRLGPWVHGRYDNLFVANGMSGSVSPKSKYLSIHPSIDGGGYGTFARVFQ